MLWMSLPPSVSLLSFKFSPDGPGFFRIMFQAVHNF